ncbi:MAG: tyrosine-type DNA invertase [Serratia sp. (in: enterobacteria)]|uniref:tyrosine-type DNA invertase n=1 Tax=Serratia sp. (in: enterobacteria) TaxID=616 RepID=UPI003F3CAA8B
MSNRKFITKEELEKVLSAVGSGLNATRDRCIITMCYIHGFRASELCNLKIADVDRESGIIHVNRMKNGLSTVHPLQPRELECIEDWMKVRGGYLGAEDQPFLFLSRFGNELSRKQLYKMIRIYGEKAGLSVQLHPHMLRHSCGYALADAGKDTRLIQDYLGHKNIMHTVLYTASNPKRFNSITI